MVFAFLGEGLGSLLGDGSIFPFIVADANVSETAIRLKKALLVLRVHLGLATFFSDSPFIDAVAYVSSVAIRLKKASFAVSSVRALFDFTFERADPFILADAYVSACAMRLKKELVVFPEERCWGSASIFPFIWADAYVSVSASLLNSEEDTGAVLVVIRDDDVLVVFLDVLLRIEETEWVEVFGLRKSAFKAGFFIAEDRVSVRDNLSNTLTYALMPKSLGTTTF